MKICPKCQKTYDDKSLNFCLDDGTVLKDSDYSTSDASDMAETVAMNNQTPFTQSNQASTTQQSFGEQQTWQQSPRYEADSGSGSKTWMWVIGTLLGIAVLCGGGGILGLAIIGVVTDDGSDSNDNKPPIARSTPKKIPKSNGGDNSRKLVKSSDFSDMKFENGEFITVNNDDGELELITRKGYYYVFALKDYSTYDASVKLTVENKTDQATPLGYGLVVHSHPKQILDKDYAFLIRSDKGQYKVVKHKNQKESEVVGWRRSSAINKGKAKNDLEVRTDGNNMKFYINGKFIRTVTDTTGYENGVAGLYTSDDVPITFTSLELRK